MFTRGPHSGLRSPGRGRAWKLASLLGLIDMAGYDLEREWDATAAAGQGRIAL